MSSKIILFSQKNIKIILYSKIYNSNGLDYHKDETNALCVPLCIVIQIYGTKEK